MSKNPIRSHQGGGGCRAALRLLSITLEFDDDSVRLKGIEQTTCSAWKRRMVERKKTRSWDKADETSEESQGSSAARKPRADARAKLRAGEIVADAFNFHTLAFSGRNVIDHSEVIHKIRQELGCEVIGLQETRRHKHTMFTATGYACFRFGPDRGKHERKGADERAVLRKAGTRESVLLVGWRRGYIHKCLAFSLGLVRGQTTLHHILCSLCRAQPA